MPWSDREVTAPATGEPRFRCRRGCDSSRIDITLPTSLWSEDSTTNSATSRHRWREGRCASRFERCSGSEVCSLTKRRLPPEDSDHRTAASEFKRRRASPRFMWTNWARVTNCWKNTGRCSHWQLGRCSYSHHERVECFQGPPLQKLCLRNSGVCSASTDAARPLF